MSKTLVLKSSILGEHSQSTKLIDFMVEQLDVAQVKVRDLAAEPLPMLDGDGAFALRGGEDLNPRQRQLLTLSDALVAEVQAVDTLVIAAPMYNFHIPVQLKAWIDLICRAGITFRYTEQGPEGLLKGKKAVVVTTRGGMHKDAPTDLITPYLSTVLGFVGISEVEFVYAEALNMGEEAQQSGLAQARRSLEALVA
ncbi:FMN-dependent NADH-azoreductase [Zobellella taiwanensis]|jgi:FMN-dependent NADH-azoreductase|uniref:FMN dependent NADH:quinone oxidoreductase n=1 Tax=Zobellella taiwanensis TaxID=347535 RepID=A0A2P7RA53_9GAMM|nr:FMN-dependent NADH-azoreductase [Zobellella taiwanensis]PSJ47101.1 FMN-dependent NADH-azoreductase [Zobellella taiwanensis]